MNNVKIEIFGNKAVIKQNKFGVWQFRMWISSEKKAKKSKAIKPFPSIKPNNTQQQTQQTTPPSKATNSLPTNNNVSASSFSAKDISDMRNDFVQKQQALQPIKPTPSF